MHSEKINVTAGSTIYSRLNSNSVKSTLDMVRRTSGKFDANTVSHLKLNNNDITDVKEILIHWPNNLLSLLHLIIISLGF